MCTKSEAGGLIGFSPLHILKGSLLMSTYCVPEIFSETGKEKHISVTVPGSKSITNRALLLAALARGKSRLTGVLFSDDSRYFIECLKSLGVTVRADEAAKTVEIEGCAGTVPNKEAQVYVGSAGTAARFISAFLGIAGGSHLVDASEQMRKRPMQPLLDSLCGVGAGVSCMNEKGHFPFVIEGAALLGSEGKRQSLSVNIDNSSQFLSALLIAFGAYSGGADIEVVGNHGMSYIDMTVKMMEQFCVKAVRTQRGYSIEGGQSYASRDYAIEPDASAACYFYAMAALLGISVTVPGIHLDSLQGDVGFLRILESMGCSYEDMAEGICLKGAPRGELSGVCADMHACSDQAITLAAIAPFASSEVRITGIRHIRLQESDRIAAICTELKRMGVDCEENEDGIVIRPSMPRPALVHTYDDHRMAMGFSLTGLRAAGIEIDDPHCCRKTFENYFEVLDETIGKLKAVD